MIDDDPTDPGSPGAVAGLGLMLAAACGGGDSGFSNGNGGNAAGGGATTGVKLTMLIGSSGDAETKAVNDATAAWAQKGGNTVTVTPAKDLTQELTQALAGGTPPDLFYVDASKFAGLVKAGALAAYGDQMPNKDDFYPTTCSSRSPRTARSTACRRTSPRSELPDQHRHVEEGRADRGRLTRRPGTSWRRWRRAHHRRGHRTGLQRHPRPGRRVHAAGRRLRCSTPTTPSSPRTPRRT